MQRNTLRILQSAWPRMSEWAKQILFLRVMMEIAQEPGNQAVTTPPVPKTIVANDWTADNSNPMRAFESTLTPVPGTLSRVRRWIETDIEPYDCSRPIVLGKVKPQ